MNTNEYNKRAAAVTGLIAGLLAPLNLKPTHYGAKGEDALARIIFEMVEALVDERNRDYLFRKLVIDPFDIPADVFDDYVHNESKWIRDDEAEGVKREAVSIRTVLKDLQRDTIRAGYRADGFKVWGAFNGHELYGREGESTAYAQHSDACGCQWLEDGDEPWEPMGDY